MEQERESEDQQALGADRDQREVGGWRGLKKRASRTRKA